MKWPPVPTQEDIAEAGGDIAVAVAMVRKTEQKVRDLSMPKHWSAANHGLDNRKSTDGCIIAPAQATA